MRFDRAQALAWIAAAVVTTSPLTAAGAAAAQPLSAAHPATPAQVAHARKQAQPAVDYVLGKLNEHKFVILGEPHWVREHVQLVREVVRRLRESAATAIAMEARRELLEHPAASRGWSKALSAMPHCGVRGGP